MRGKIDAKTNLNVTAQFTPPETGKKNLESSRSFWPARVSSCAAAGRRRSQEGQSVPIWLGC